MLELHGGRCFVPDTSNLVSLFRKMEKAGLVTIENNAAPIPGITVTAAGFKPVVILHNDEEQTH